MFEFIIRSIKIAGQNKNKLVAGMVMIFLQNFSYILNFAAIYVSFQYITDRKEQNLWLIIAILVAAFSFIFITNWLQNALIGGVFFSIYRDYRLDVGEKLKRAGMGYFTEQSLAKILSCFTNVLKNLEMSTY